MIITTETDQIYTKESEAKNPHQKRALILIESDNLRQRLMGFALISTCFHLCDPETQEYVEKKWKQEKNLKEIKREFVDFCTTKFKKRQFMFL